jgi:serine/threonine-protein kinase HipA
MPAETGIWLRDERIGTLEQGRWPRVRIRYSDDTLGRLPLNSPLLSCSLPLARGPLDATAFCIGLLPEGQALASMAAGAKLAVNDTFGLLRRYGRDVAGALVIGTEPPGDSSEGVVPYDSEGLAKEVEDLEAHPLGAYDDSELSLAGLQDKLLLVRLPDGRWGRPTGGRPSTHILKREDRRFPGLVDAEAQCLALARAVSLTTVETELLDLGGWRCMVVSRFDRAEKDGVVHRVHQEDLCQALGIDPNGARGRAKYEQPGIGPSFRRLAELLDTYAADPLAELDRLAGIVAFTVAVGNADAHGKNLALLHPDAESVTLAPLYDTVPTALWPGLRREAAMAIGGQPLLDDVSVEDVVREGLRWPHPADRTRAVVRSTLEGLLGAIEEGVIPEDSEVARLVGERSKRILGT